MEHLQHFGLGQDPFENEPDLRFYFDSASHRDAQRRAERGLRQTKGLSVLTGVGGTGKTLIARRILEALEDEMFESSLVVMLPGPADANSVLRRFASQLDVEEPSTDRSRLLGQVYESLAVVREDGRHSVLILDEAHHLGPVAIAEVGALLTLEYEDRRLLSLLLVGLPELETVIASNSALAQRIDVRVELQPLDLDNTRAYLSHRLHVANGRPDLIAPDAVDVLHKFARGRPRLLNTLVDNALFDAFLAGRHQLGSMDFEGAAQSLGLGSGADSGSKYTQVARPAAEALPSATPPPAVSQPVGIKVEVTRPIMDNSGSEFDIDELLGGSSSAADLTTVLQASPVVSGATLDLDAELEAVLGPQAEPGVQSPVEAQPLPTAALAEPTRIAFREETAEETLPPDPDATRIVFPEEMSGETVSAEQAGDEIDDLFVELMED